MEFYTAGRIICPHEWSAPERLRLLALILRCILMASVGSNATIAVHQGENPGGNKLGVFR